MRPDTKLQIVRKELLQLLEDGFTGTRESLAQELAARGLTVSPSMLTRIIRTCNISVDLSAARAKDHWYIRKG